MNKRQYLQAAADVVCGNIMKESTTTADNAAYAPLLLPLVKKIYPEMLTSQITDLQPMTGPVSKVAALFGFYKPTDAVDLTNCRIVTLSGPAPAVGTNVTTSSGGVGVVLYVEGTVALVLFSAGGTAVGETMNPGALTVTNTTINRAAVKKIFHQYSLGTETGSPRELHYEIRTMTTEAKSRKVKTKLTLEQLTDIMAIYGESAPEVVAQMLSNEIIQEIDMETIDYIRSIATPHPDLILANSPGMANDNMSIGNDIYLNIFYCAEQIVKATKRNRTMFVLADSATVGLLLTNPLHVTVDDDEDNPFYVGKLGSYNLYCDIYATDHYVTVGYRGIGQGDGDTGIIYSPYTDSITVAQNPENFGQNMMYMSRYAMTRHPQDQGTGLADSDFFRSFAIDFAGMKNYNPAQ